MRTSHLFDTSALLTHYFVEHIRLSTKERIPLIDALIASCARSAGAVLVHKDPHMAVIPEGVVSQIYLAK